METLFFNFYNNNNNNNKQTPKSKRNKQPLKLSQKKESKLEKAISPELAGCSKTELVLND